METTLTVPQGSFQLSRYPTRPKETLRAWDAADELLLNHISDQQLLTNKPSILILNDSFGALSVALADYNPQMQSDSYLAHQGTLANLQANIIPTDQVTLLDSLALPEGPLDLVLIKLPKSMAMLEDQLYRLRPLITSETQIIAAAMAKHIHSSTLKLIEKLIGPTQTSLAQKKARLIFTQQDESLAPNDTPYPKRYKLEGTDYRIANHANVFSQASLDIGTRFFLKHLPHTEGEIRIVDLGCGNGVVGLMAAAQNPEAELFFVDESFMAVASAKENFQGVFGEREAQFIPMDCLSDFPAESVDLILNNPPFHQQHAVGDHIAWQMFKQSHSCLTQGGELWVIGNRHLGYHIKLKKLFGNCETVASNNKFVVLRAIKG